MRKTISILLFVVATSAFTVIPSPACQDKEQDKEKCLSSEGQPFPVTQPNPAVGWSVLESGTEADPLAGFSHFPLDKPRQIPAGGNFKDPERGYPHYGIDFTDYNAHLKGLPKPIYAIGLGIVTAIQPCLPCWADSHKPGGQKHSITGRYNFGFGGLVVIEHPYNEYLSLYSLYSHVRDIQTSVGRRVDTDTVLAFMGTTGDSIAPHVHLEVRYGLPGQFWAADFSSQEVVDRWVGLNYDNPFLLLVPENHAAFARILEGWIKVDYPARERQVK